MSAADFRTWARDIQQFERDAPRHAIEKVDEAVRRALQRDTGGDGAFSRGRGLGRASTRVSAQAGEAEVSAAGSGAVWGILEGGTGGHEVRAAPGRVLRTPYGPRPVVHVSGVAARHTFSEAARAGMADAAAALEAAWGGL